jgi:uncharacterized protein involved in exopolysaccharide biosynthesis
MPLRYPGTRDTLSTLWSLKWRMAFVFFMPVAACLAVIIYLPPKYRAEAQLLVKTDRELRYRPETGAAPGVLPEVIDNRDVLQSNIAILVSRDVIVNAIGRVGLSRLFPAIASGQQPWPTKLVGTVDRLAAQFGLRRTAPPEVPKLELAVDQFRRSLVVEAIKRTALIAVTVDSADKDIAAEAANALVQSFLFRAKAIYSNSAVQSAQRQVTRDEAVLADAERAMTEYRAANEVYQPTEQMRLLLDRQSTVDRSLAQTRSQVLELLQRQASIANQERSFASAMTIPTLTTAYKSQVLNTLTDLAASRVRERELSNEAMKVQGQIDQLSSKQTGLIELERKVGIYDQNVKVSSRRLAEELAAADLESGMSASFTVVSPAVAPVKPFRPAPITYMTIAVVCGIALAAATLAIGLLKPPKVLVSRRQIEDYTGLPILADLTITMD